jgi:AcrR family transcriptional regulator
MTIMRDVADEAKGGGAPRPRRGRPRRVVQPQVGPGLDNRDPTADLPATARSILAAARTVLAERGLEGFTIEAVANAANVSRTLIPYHFGSRAGLVEILFDSLFHDFAVGIVRRQLADPSKTGLPQFLDLVRLEVADTAGQRDFFELVVAALREEELRKRIAALYDSYRVLALEMVGIAPCDDPQRQRELTMVGTVLQAVNDGLGLHAALDPEFDIEAAVATVERLLGPAIAELRTAER